MNLSSLSQLNFSGRKVVFRADFDVVSKDGHITDASRLENIIPSISYLLDNGATQVILYGHMGRPENYQDKSLSLRPIYEFLKNRITPSITFVDHQPFDVFYQVQEEIFKSNDRLVLLENLRYWKEEEENSHDFAEDLAYVGEVFVNDAFASSHRDHASIVGIPNFIKEKAFGLQFVKEVENLSKIFENPQAPVISIISGLKKDKLEYLEKFKNFCDKVLVAGRLPEFLPESFDDPKIIVANLNPDKEDVTIHSIENFEKEISGARTILLNGPIGKYEDPGHKMGTERVFLAVSRANAFKVAGGGDTLAAINFFGIADSFNWISSGGGASLDFLANKTLPGIEAIVKKI